MTLKVRRKPERLLKVVPITQTAASWTPIRDVGQGGNRELAKDRGRSHQTHLVLYDKHRVRPAVKTDRHLPEKSPMVTCASPGRERFIAHLDERINL